MQTIYKPNACIQYRATHSYMYRVKPQRFCSFRFIICQFLSWADSFPQSTEWALIQNLLFQRLLMETEEGLDHKERDKVETSPVCGYRHKCLGGNLTAGPLSKVILASTQSLWLAQP